MAEGAIPPLAFQWDGEHMTPFGRFGREAQRYFVVGEIYNLVEESQRSSVTHKHFFACVNEAWRNVPEHLNDQFPTAEHLRKFALIKTGFADSQQFVASSKAEALRIAAFLRPVDEYAIIVVRDAVVTRYTAQSQSKRAMGKQRFAESKDLVLNFCAELIGVSPDQLTRNGGMSA